MEKNDSNKAEGELPLCAKYEPKRFAFWLTRRRGKSLSNGGYGIILQKRQEGTTSPNVLLDGDGDGSTTISSEEYLLLEETIFLHERGVLEVQDEDGAVMDSKQIYALLNHKVAKLGMPLAAYLAYAHLRQQGFRVVRHSKRRTEVLKEMIKYKENEQQSQSDCFEEELKDDIKAASQGRKRKRMLKNNEWSKLKLDLRLASAEAVPLLVQNENKSSATTQNTTSIYSPPVAWDAYAPDRTFSRATPGIPDFSVIVAPYNEGTIQFAQLANCIEQNDHIPLKIATVSDSGIVVLFGVTNEGVPPIVPVVKSNG